MKWKLDMLLAQNYWGQGIVTEAVEEIIKFGFEELKLKNITSRCNPDKYWIISEFWKNLDLLLME